MKKKRIRIIIVLVIMLIFGIAVFYVNDYYRANEVEIESFIVENDVKTEILEGDNIVCIPDEIKAGMIFYPGGKVECTSYLPLMRACASKGILTVLVEMPFNLAVLDIKAAEGILEEYPEVSNWYMAGHSLGGTMAASYAIDNAVDYEGLVLLGSYTTEEMQDVNLKVLSIYGSEDEVMNMESYIKYKQNLPGDFEEKILEGGNHAGFGMYGMQEGDGVAVISNEEQILQTAEFIYEFINE